MWSEAAHPYPPPTPSVSGMLERSWRTLANIRLLVSSDEGPGESDAYLADERAGAPTMTGFTCAPR